MLETHDAIDEKPASIAKRSGRVAKIELLVKELKQHLRSASDHASNTGELLPRPTQEMMAGLTGLNKFDVSRCLKDNSANELRLLWQTADDLEAVLLTPLTRFTTRPEPSSDALNRK